MTARILNAPLILSFTLSADDIISQDALTFGVVLKNISVQTYSPPQGTAVMQYTGLNVQQGYWISNRLYGKAYQITSIDTTNTTVSEVYCTVTDVDGYIAAISEDRLNAPGEGTGFIFTTNEDGDPILTPADSAGTIAGQWQGDIVSHFSARKHKSQYVSIYQTVAKRTITDASITGVRTLYYVADTSGLTVGNTVIIEGIELDLATGYNGRGSIHAIDPNVSVTVNIESNGTPVSFEIATLRIGSVPIGKDFVVGESIYIDSSGIFRKSAGSLQISDTVGIVTSKSIPSDDWFSFRPSGKYFDTTVFPNDFFPTPAIIQQVGGNNVTLTAGMKLYVNPNAGRQYTSVAPTSNPYATWIMISATRAIYIAGSGGGGGSATVVTGTVQVFDGGDPTWVSAPPTTIYPVLDCGVLF